MRATTKLPMTHGGQKVQASHTGQARQDASTCVSAQTKERLIAICPSSRQAAVRQILEDAPEKVTCKEFVQCIDGVYNEISQVTNVTAEASASSADIADTVLSAVAPTGTEINELAALIYIAVYSARESLRTYGEQRLFHYVFDLEADLKLLPRVGCARLFIMVLMRTKNLLVSTNVRDIELRINNAASVAIEILTRDEETPPSGRKDKNDIFNNITNLKLETRSMKKLLNKAQWDVLCSDLRFYAPQPPPKQLSRFVSSLRRACEYVAFNTDMDEQADYVHLITRSFLNTKFQVDLLLHFVENIASQHHVHTTHGNHREQFEKVVPGYSKALVDSVAWAIDTDVLCRLLALLYNRLHVAQFKVLIQQILRDASQAANGHVLAKAIMYALTTLWIRDHDLLSNREDVIQVRLATLNPLFWYCYELCLQQFVSSDELIMEIRQLGGESIHGKKFGKLFEFMGEMAKSLRGEYIILAIMEVMRYVRYNVHVLSFMMNLFHAILLDVFKSTQVNFSKGILEIVCFCRQNFDWGFMTMLIYSVDAIMSSELGPENEYDGRKDVAKDVLAGGFIDYLRWKIQQMREFTPEGDVAQKIFVPSCNVVAELFCILNHTIGTCDELLDLFQTYDTEYKALNHYNVLLMPLYKALEVRANAELCETDDTVNGVPNHTPVTQAADSRETEGDTKGVEGDIYGYLMLSEDMETTTSQVVDIILSCKLHQNILNAVSLLNADAESLRSQTILDVLLRKYINRLVAVLNLSVPPDFCLHAVTAFDEEGLGVAPRLTMLAKFTGQLLKMRLGPTQCDSVYILFRIIMEAFRRNKVFLLEFAIEAFGAMGNVLCYPAFTRLLVNEERFCKLYPQFVSQVRNALNDVDAEVFEINPDQIGSMVFEETRCLKNAVDTKGRGNTGLMILKQSSASGHELELDADSSSVAPSSASMVFSIVNLAANVQYKQVAIDATWYQEQISLNTNNVTLDDLLAMLNIDFQAPTNALEIMSIMEISLSNKNFITHVEQLVTKGYVDWLLFVIYRYVLMRGYTHFRDCIVFMATLGGTRMVDAMVKFTAHCLNIFLKYLRSCRGNAVYHKLLSVSCGWLGAITLGRNKPLLTKHLDLKYLIIYAYQNGLLGVILPAVCKLMLNVKSSKIFKLPNPWTSSLLNLLADINMSSGLKSTLQFDLSLLFKNLDFVPGPRSVHSVIKEVPISDMDRSPKLGSSIWSTVSPNAGGLGMLKSQLDFQVPPVTQEVRTLLQRKIVLNPKVSSLNTKWPWVDMILSAIESCYMESSELIKRTMMTCIATTRSIFITDFATRKRELMEINPEVLKMSATAMASGLTTSLIMANGREQLCNLMSLRLHMQILSVLSMEPSNGDNALTNNLEQVSGCLAKDNLGLVCALVEQATLELITGYIAASIGEWVTAIGKESMSLPPDPMIGLQANNGLEAYKRFGGLVPFTMTRLQKEKQHGSPQQGPYGGMMGGQLPNFNIGSCSPPTTDAAGSLYGVTPRGAVPGYRLPDFMIIPPIDNLPTSLISCKVDEFEHRVKEAAKHILMHPPTIPLLNSKYMYTTDSSTLLLLSCLPRNHTLFTLLWSMDYMFQHAANQAECVEALIKKVLKTSKENTKGLDVVSIMQEVEYSLLEMLSVGCPLLIEIVTNLIPTLGPARLCQFVRHRILKIPTVDRFISTGMDTETLCRTLHKLVLDGQWLGAGDLPMSMNKLASLDPSGMVTIHLSAGPVTLDHGELHRRLMSHSALTAFGTEVDNRGIIAHYATGKDRMMAPGMMSVASGSGLTLQPGLQTAAGMSSGLRSGNPESRLRSLRQLVLDKSIIRNKMVIKLCEIPGKERYLQIFKEYLMIMESDPTPFYQNFNEHPPDAFLTCTLLCALQMTFEPQGTEMKGDRLPQICHDSPVWTYCDGWSTMVAGLSRNESFMLHKALHLMLGMMQHGVGFICFERMLIGLINELENDLVPLISIGHFLTLCGPSEIPEFGSHWINIITRKQFAQQIIQNPNEWPLYHHLLVEALTSPHSKTPCISFILVTLMQKVPEFLCGYYLSLCDVVPPRAMQLRNLLTSAVPRSLKLPNPISMDDHMDIPSLNFTNHIITVVKAGGLKVATDMFVHDPSEALLPVARHMLLSCMTNHLRYPNVTTFAFIAFMLRLFKNGDQPMQEQITLAILERLLISRPHPWGVLHLLFQLVKDPKYDFWNRIQAAPEVEKHIRRIIQSCLNTKPGQHSKPSSASELVN
ncbi:CCR4-NOT transcription complex subunit 1 [Babesia ovata]|uniref:CCR4-NOT transcription complex subunit 1 n=1 Tax=Babesia ovata TaxID=189622 RepID=A0A2H6KCD4_9APIC|nr:CCR4-NOT transcription complex subunit 1 [Babesia ovata]GBE60658.1 CCR4-NOT transcription complex subunit 1 [Babesia ovata]